MPHSGALHVRARAGESTAICEHRALAAVCAAAVVFLYWLIVVGEGTYLGRAAVRLIYQLGAGVSIRRGTMSQ